MINSDNIELRAPEISDADFMYDVENDRDAWLYSDTVAPISRRQLRDYALDYDADPFRAGQLRLIIYDKESGTPLGIADLYDVSQRHQRAFCAIYVTRKYRNSGVASSAIKRMTDYCRNVLLLNRLFAYIDKNNLYSIKVFRNTGFTCESTLKEWIKTSDGFSDVFLMSKKL